MFPLQDPGCRLNFSFLLAQIIYNKPLLIMRFSTVLVTSSLILSGFAAAQRFGDFDVYARSFDADAM